MNEMLVKADLKRLFVFIRTDVDVRMAGEAIISDLPNHLAGCQAISDFYPRIVEVNYDEYDAVGPLQSDDRCRIFTHNSGRVRHRIDVQFCHHAVAWRQNILVPSKPILIPIAVIRLSPRRRATGGGCGHARPLASTIFSMKQSVPSASPRSHVRLSAPCSAHAYPWLKIGCATATSISAARAEVMQTAKLSTASRRIIMP